MKDRDDPITKQLENSGPNWKRFIYDLDSDADSEEFEDIKWTKKLPSKGTVGRTRARHPRGQRLRESLTRKESKQDTVAGNVPGVDGCMCTQCRAGDCGPCEDWKDISEDEDDILSDASDDDHETMHLAMEMEGLDVGDDEEDPEAAFMRYLDREKAKVFKRQWHEAVIDPEERARYHALSDLVQTPTPQKGSKTMTKQDKNLCLRTLIWLRTHISAHRLVWKDMERAFAATSIYFTTASSGEVDLSAEAAETKAQLADNAARAQRLRPYSRSFHSNLSASNEFWSEVDDVYKTRRKDDSDYYQEWDKVLRPSLAHWFKSGFLAPGYLPYPTGNATVKRDNAACSQTDAGEIYFDYRSHRDEWPNPLNGFTAIKNPYDIGIFRMARKWDAEHHPTSRFALLRIWSHSHFYPLMLGWDNRSSSSFTDAIGRSWEWKFVPKDNPGSEWSMQKSVELRVEPFKRQFGKQAVVKRDMLLIMGCDEQDLRRMTLGAIFALQTDPWRLEVDLWKSFINVDLEFLERLDRVWLE